MPRPSKTVMLLLWLGCSGIGLLASVRSELTPGEAASAPLIWPIRSALERPDSALTMVTVIHPMCACTRATLAELEYVLSHISDRAPDSVKAYILVDFPHEAPEWETSPLVAGFRSLPGVTIIDDLEGREALLFGARTSGQTYLYSSDGTLLFSGGLTGSRGHTGVNSGREGLLAAIRTHPASPERSAVFGCGLPPPREARRT